MLIGSVYKCIYNDNKSYIIPVTSVGEMDFIFLLLKNL